MKVLITGVSGQLGSELAALSKYETYGLYLKNKPECTDRMFNVNVADRKDVLSIVKKLRPDWLIHCAALTDMDLCEDDKELAWNSNVIGTKNVIDACREFGVKPLFISTDYVFDGTVGSYKEGDAPNPMNFYGKTKLIGEWLTQCLTEHVIVRTSMLFSHNKGKFIGWVTDGMRKGKLSGVVDIYSSPTLASELATGVLELIERDVRGIFHAAGDDKISRYELIRKFVAAFGYDSDIVKPVESSRLNLKAKRLKDSSLDTSKIKGLGIKFSNVSDAIKKLKESLDNS